MRYGFLVKYSLKVVTVSKLKMTLVSREALEELTPSEITVQDLVLEFKL